MTLECIKEMAFDQSIINPNQVLTLNLKKELLHGQDFRMNERTFNYQLSAASGSNQQEFEENPLFRDHWAE